MSEIKNVNAENIETTGFKLRKELKKNKSLLIGSIIVIILLTIMIVSFFYTPFDPNGMNIVDRFKSPDSTYIFGTDNFGRDILSRIMEGAKTAFFVGSVSVGLSLAVGGIIGAVAGYFGGWIDELFMRIIDALMAFPGILIAIMFIAVFGAGIVNTTIALGIMGIPTFARVSRSGFIQYREFEFIKAAKSIGANPVRIIAIHILPNVVSVLIITSSIAFASAILSESALSYLGLGVTPPDPSWGRMLNEAQSYLSKAPWYAIAPGLMITLTVLGFNLLGDGIQDALDPRK